MSFIVSATRWSDVYISAASRFLAGAAMFTTSVTLVLHLQTSGLGGLAVAALTLASTLPLVLLSPITGRMADRFDSRRLILLSGAVQAGATFAMVFTNHLVALLALSMLVACGTALLQPVMGALLPTMATKDDLPKAAAVGQTGALVGMMAGPALAGVLVGELGPETTLLAAAAMSVLRTVASLNIRTRRGGNAPATATGNAPATTTWRLRDDRLVATMIIGLAAVVGVLSAANVTEVFLVRESFGASETLYGIINATWMAGMAVGAWLFAMVISRTRHDGQLAYLLFGLLGASSLVMFAGGALTSITMVVPLFLIGGAANAGENSVVAVTMARRVPLEQQGRAIAKESGIVNGTTMVGFVGGGLALEYLDPRTIFMALGIGGLVAVIACLTPVIRAGRAVGAETSVNTVAGATTSGDTAPAATGSRPAADPTPEPVTV